MRSLSVGMGAFLLLASVACGGQRSKEVGVLDYLKKYTETPSKKACMAATECCWKVVKEAGLEPEWVDVDIFLPQNKAQRDQFKRIVIPTSTEWFTIKMYEGMDDYVRSGGLLMTNCSCILLDANENYKGDKEDTTTEYCRDNFLGVRGHASAVMRQIKARFWLLIPVIAALFYWPFAGAGVHLFDGLRRCVGGLQFKGIGRQVQI